MGNLNELIEEELRKRKADYLSSPIYLLEHYHNEKGNVEAYNGRQLLEMLQNADDASETAKVKKVLIKLIGNELVIANNGEPFNEDGFSSIIYSNASPKTMQQNKIGQKGLGFRSILSWSDEVIISSGGTKLAFSETIAREFLQNLISESDKVAKFIKQKSNSRFPIATLRIPKLLNGIKGESNQFDTTITIKLKENILDEVQSQILSIINKETLIFLNNIEIIEIESPDRNIVYKKYYKGENKSLITIESINLKDSTKESKTWSIKRKNGTHKNKNYELAIAWNNDLNDSENVLFSYFKTKVRFPFPALLHGTFELSPDRNELVNDTEGHNKFLIGKLAELLIETSLEIASKNGVANYSAVKLLNIDFGSMDNLLNEFGFKTTIQEKIKESNIFPTVNGKYISYTPPPAFYKYPVANIFSGKGVDNLLKFTDEEPVLKTLESFGICHYHLEYYLTLISAYKDDCSKLAKLIFYLLNFSEYQAEYTTPEFELAKQAPFLIDNENELIPWDTNIFIQPSGENEFKLPKSLKVRFVSSDLVGFLLEEFKKTDIDFIIEKLGIFQVKKYSFIKIAETIIHHYNEKKNATASDVKELHLFLFRLFKRELKGKIPIELAQQITILAISSNGKIRNVKEMYFGKNYGNQLTERLYSFDKSKLLASPHEFGLEIENLDIVNKYFLWIGVASLPRYSRIELSTATEKYNDYKEYVLRNYDYRKPTDFNEYYKDYNHLVGDLWNVPKITVGSFDDLKKILIKARPETIFEWVKKDEQLRKTLEEDCETLSNTEAQLYLRGKQYYRKIKGINLRSYTRWLFATTEWLPIESENKKSVPDKCCLSKTITEEFSPFVEKPKVDIPTIADKLELPESTIENYLIFIGVHREISSFSISALYNVLSSLPVSDKEGKAARKIYREIISNFNESRVDSNHPAYKSFIKDGKMFCQKGSDFGYYLVKETYYIPTKTYGNNVLRLFPLALIDSKQGAQKIEKLFGVKRLKDISFSVIGEPIINSLNDEFQNEIDRFKGLIYVLRMNKDTNHDIANKLKKLKIFLAQELQTNFTHNEESTNFELESYEYITHKKRNNFYISVPSSLTSLTQLREANKFCQSIAEIFSTLIETEEYNDFIHDLYSKPEFGREPRLLSLLEKDDNTDILSAKKQLDIIDDVRLSFWRAFSIASNKNIRTDIRNEKDLTVFLKGKMKLKSESIEKVSSEEFFSQINDLANQEFIYDLFIEFGIDHKSFVRHFTGIDFSILFKNRIEDFKIIYRDEFASQLYFNLLSKTKNEKEKYFDSIDDYSLLEYDIDDGFLKAVEFHFITTIRNQFSITLKKSETNFSIDERIKEMLAVLRKKEIIIPDLLKEKRSFQAFLLFNDEEEIMRQIEAFKVATQNSPTNTNSNQIKVRGATIEYESYESLAEKVLEGLDITNLNLKISKTLKVEDGKGSRNKRPGRRKTRNVRFNTKNEEQIGFIAELICFHKLAESYGEENVNWISENAYRAYPDRFITGEAGKGYDLELTDGGKVRFLEIKGSSNIREGIYMTKEEIQTALTFPDKYDLLIVENPLSEEPYIRHIKSPFKFKKDETLFANEKIKVFNDNYVIKFQWKE
jgi:hypothetical protein